MFWLATVGCVLLGGVIGYRGVRRALARRRSARPRSRDRLGRGLLAAGAGLLLAPDLIPAIFFDYPGVFGTLALWGWRGFVGFGLSVLLIGAMLTRREVIDAGRTGAAAAVVRLPSVSGWRMRRELRLPDFPRSWPELHEYDRTLSRRLVGYQHDLEQAANRPAMTDYTEPATRAAVAAMTACDRARTDATPFVRDVITTPYGRAVAEFAVALREAEENALRQVKSGLRRDERDRLAEAARIIAFIQENGTSGSEREQAYAHVAELLRVEYPAVEEGRRHPWLDVHQRAHLHDTFGRTQT